ncbi:hypothetical protein [Lentzea sp. NPDC051838]|uniref:hypothetical protein n=1 Tax=Lentzea sp. NPDC051838 TaxID=3154849 RepID=UPI0034264D58
MKIKTASFGMIALQPYGVVERRGAVNLAEREIPASDRTAFVLVSTEAIELAEYA